MTERLEFQELYRVDGYGLIVVFSDGTSAQYTVDELAQMRPARMPTEKIPESATKQGPHPH